MVGAGSFAVTTLALEVDAFCPTDVEVLVDGSLIGDVVFIGTATRLGGPLSVGPGNGRPGVEGNLGSVPGGNPGFEVPSLLLVGVPELPIVSEQLCISCG